MLQMVQNCGKLMNALNSERKGSFHRLLGEFPTKIPKSFGIFVGGGGANAKIRGRMTIGRCTIGARTK